MRKENDGRMSKTILELETPQGKLYVAAFVGNQGDAGVQLSTANDYVQLNSDQALRLIDALQRRLNREEGYRATDV